MFRCFKVMSPVREGEADGMGLQSLPISLRVMRACKFSLTDGYLLAFFTCAAVHAI